MTHFRLARNTLGLKLHLRKKEGIWATHGAITIHLQASILTSTSREVDYILKIEQSQLELTFTRSTFRIWIIIRVKRNTTKKKNFLQKLLDRLFNENKI